MSTVPARALTAYNASIREDLPAIVDELRRTLGAKLVAYIAGVTSTRQVREWAEGTHIPVPDTRKRLRTAYRVAHLIGESEGYQVVPTWFQGMNPHLGDSSPARILRDHDPDVGGPRVVAAADAFVGA